MNADKIYPRQSAFICEIRVFTLAVVSNEATILLRRQR